MNDRLPYFYNAENVYNSSVSPNTVHCRNTQLTGYFARYLIEKAISVFEWLGIPDNWDADFMKYVIYCNGFCCVVNTDKFGVIPLNCTLSGKNVFYRPTKAMISNPLLKSRSADIGKNCEIIKLQPNYNSVIDIVMFYADLMAVAVETLSVNLFNSKLSYVLFSKDKAQAETLKKMFDTIASGEPAVAVGNKTKNADGSPAWDAFTQNISQNFISENVLSVLRTLEGMFDAEIGLPNVNTDKRERMVVDEVNANNRSTFSKAELWLDCLKEGVEKVNKMFGLSLSVDWRHPPEQVEMSGGGEDAND